MHDSQLTIDDFFAFCIERAAIRTRKDVDNQPPPWSSDPIFQQYRFTNINRAHDYGTWRMVEEITRSHICRCSYEQVIHYVCCYRFLGSPVWIIDGDDSTRKDLTFNTRFADYIAEEQTQIIRHRQRTGIPVMRMTAYQINVPKDMSAIDLVCDKLWPILPFEIMQLINTKIGLCKSDGGIGMLAVRAIIASHAKAQGYNYTWFHGMEIAKDLALLFPKFVDAQSLVALGPGAIAGLSRIKHAFSGEELFYELQNESVTRGIALTLSNIEHALCEFNKYCEAKYEGKTSRSYVPRVKK